MHNVILLPSAAADAVANPRWHGRYPRVVVPAWRVRRAREERAASERRATAAATCLQGDAARRNVLEMLTELTDAANQGQIDGMIFIVRFSEGNICGGAAGDYRSADGGPVLPDDVVEALATVVDLLD